MPTSSAPAVALRLVAERGVVRAREVEAAGVAPVVLTRLVRQGRLERLARGLYALPGTALPSGQSLPLVALRVPGSVVCLGSALQVHGLSTWISPEVWIAVGRHRRPPRMDWPRLRVVYVGDRLLEEGVECRRIDGVDVRLTSPARTVADCFKWRRLVGLDVAVEALRAWLAGPRRNRDDLRRMASLCRVVTVMRPYLEALQ